MTTTTGNNKLLEAMNTNTRQWCHMMQDNSLLLAWNVCAFGSVIVPLIVYGICHARFQEEEGGGSQDNAENNNNGGNWWWWNNNNNNNENNQDDNEQDNENNNNGGGWSSWWWNNNNNGEERRREEEQQYTGALIFCYIWTLLMFMTIVYYGHKHIVANRRDDKTFLLVLVMFANLCLVGVVLTTCLGLSVIDERQREEGGAGSWFGASFAFCMVLTYGLWMFLCSVFGGILYKPPRYDEKEYDSSTRSDYNYQRHDDNATTNAGATGTWSMWSGARPVMTRDEVMKQQQRQNSENHTSSWTVWGSSMMGTGAATDNNNYNNKNVSQTSSSSNHAVKGSKRRAVNQDNNNDDDGPMSPLECLGIADDDDNETADGARRRQQQGTMA